MMEDLEMCEALLKLIDRKDKFSLYFAGRADSLVDILMVTSGIAPTRLLLPPTSGPVFVAEVTA
jgi:hypothetical protein